MGFAVSYRSARPVSQSDVDAIIREASAANLGRTWLSCEPVFLFPESDGHLAGSSKPNFIPDPGDVASAATEQMPDGTLRDLVAILCKLSLDHGIDWEIRHDYEPDPIGAIKDGVADEEMLEEIEALAQLGDALSDLSDEDLE